MVKAWGSRGMVLQQPYATRNAEASSDIHGKRQTANSEWQKRYAVYVSVAFEKMRVRAHSSHAPRTGKSACRLLLSGVGHQVQEFRHERNATIRASLAAFQRRRL